jgi:hypothetical protein
VADFLWAHLGSNQGPSDYESVANSRNPLFSGLPNLHFGAKYDISALHFRTPSALRFCQITYPSNQAELTRLTLPKCNNRNQYTTILR